MNLFTKTSLWAALLIIGIAGMSFGLSVDVTNYTDDTIYYLYVSPDTSAEWEEDVLGEEVLSAGETVTVTLEGYDSCIFDFMAVFSDESSSILHDVDVCEHDVIFQYEDGAEETDYDSTESYEDYADDYALSVDAQNNTDVDIFYLYASPDSSDEWEEDVLGDDVLSAGETITITLTGYNECIWDFRAIFADEDDVSVYDIDVCEQDVIFGYQ